MRGHGHVRALHEPPGRRLRGPAHGGPGRSAGPAPGARQFRDPSFAGRGDPAVFPGRHELGPGQARRLRAHGPVGGGRPQGSGESGHGARGRRQPKGKTGPDAAALRNQNGRRRGLPAHHLERNRRRHPMEGVPGRAGAPRGRHELRHHGPRDPLGPLRVGVRRGPKEPGARRA
jgi:hypothetical protein